jgi:hypothetical protein
VASIVAGSCCRRWPPPPPPPPPPPSPLPAARGRRPCCSPWPATAAWHMNDLRSTHGDAVAAGRSPL